MKTAVSIPDSVFKAADRAAKRLGVSRSELYARALKQYLARSRAEAVTEALNRVYSSDDSLVDEGLSRAQFSVLPDEDW